MIRRRLVMTGRVQNVFYRDWLVEQARSLGVDGWVRNRADGSVEAVVEGPPEMIDAIVAKARIGSPSSRVSGIAITHDAPVETLDGFEKRPTQ